MKLYPNEKYIPLLCVNVNESGERILNFFNEPEGLEAIHHIVNDNSVFLNAIESGSDVYTNKLTHFKEAFTKANEEKICITHCLSDYIFISPYAIGTKYTEYIHMLACVRTEDFLNPDVNIFDSKNWIYLLNENTDNFLLKYPFHNQFLSVAEIDKKTNKNRIKVIANRYFDMFKGFRFNTIIEYDSQHQLEMGKLALNNLRQKEVKTPVDPILNAC